MSGDTVPFESHFFCIRIRNMRKSNDVSPYHYVTVYCKTNWQYITEGCSSYESEDI